VLESQRDLTSPRALVIRDAVEKRIAGVDVVSGDLVMAEGDRVPADATVLAAHDLQCNESLLTGEAVLVRKIASPGTPPARPAAMICPTSIRAAWWFGGMAAPRSPRPARAARSARSALRSPASTPIRRGRASRQTGIRSASGPGAAPETMEYNREHAEAQADGGKMADQPPLDQTERSRSSSLAISSNDQSPVRIGHNEVRLTLCWSGMDSIFPVPQPDGVCAATGHIATFAPPARRQGVTPRS